MRGIRVFHVPHDVEEKHLKIYFSKKENNGGTIETIYYPLTNNDAVITFKGAEVVNRLLEIDHTLKSSPLKIQRLPEHTIFTSLEAKLSSDVSSLIIATTDLQDQIRYVADIDIISTEAETQEGSANQTLCFRGNWFQLEWAWNMLACIMQQQDHFSQPDDGKSDAMSFQQSNSINRPMEKSDVHNRRAEKLRRRQQHLGVDGFGKVEAGFIRPNQSDQVPGSKPKDSLGHNKSASYETFVKKDTDDHKIGLTGESKRNGRQDTKEIIQSKLMQHGDGKLKTRSAKLSHTDNRREPFDDPPRSPEQSMGLLSLSSQKSESFTKHGINSSLSPTDDMAGMQPSRREAPEARHSPYDSKFQHLRVDKERLGSSVTQPPLQSSYSTDDRSFKTDIEGIQVAIYHGSLLEEDTGAIVNAANEQLEHYGGIAYAIAKARGPEINTECSKYIREHGSLKKTEAMCTSGGGRIKADYIIHAAGPMWLSLWKETFHQELTRTFLNCFRLAEKLSLTSVAVPAISTGVYGAPLDECIKSFIDAVLLFSREQKRLTDIRMLNNDAENAATSIVLMKTILEAPIDQLMKHALASNTGDSHRDLNIPRGRQERSGSFPRTYSKLTDKAGTAKSSKSSTSYRLSSHSRLTDFTAKEDKHQPTSYELKKSGYSAESMGVSPRDSHSTNRTEPRQYGPSSRSSQSSEIESHNVPYPTAEKATPRMKFKLKQ